MDPAKKGQALDEDDEFEEFPVDDWGPDQMDPADPSMWDKSWDDNSLDDYVGQQVRTQAEKLLPAPTAQQQQQQPAPGKQQQQQQ